MALKPFYNKKYHLGKDPAIIKKFLAPVNQGSVPVTARTATAIPVTRVVNYNDNTCDNVNIPQIDIYGLPSDFYQYHFYVPTNLPNHVIIPTQAQVLTLMSDGYLEIPYTDNPADYYQPNFNQQVTINLTLIKLYLSQVDLGLYKGVNNLPAIPEFSFTGGLYESVIDYTGDNYAKFYFTKIV